jgi:hypothetical protein
MFILTFFLGFTGIILFIGQENTGWFDAPFALQRSLILASWLVAATGAVLLAGVRPSDRASALLVAGVEFFVVGALIAAVAEVSLLTREFTVASVIGVVFASSLFVGEALIGAGLLRSGLVSTWVAWTVMVWNVLWLVTLLVISREDMYYPGLHYIPLLLIGIPLVDRRRRESLRQIPEDR